MNKWFLAKLLRKNVNNFLTGNLVNNKENQSTDIILLRLDAIGDFVIWLDSAKAYKEIYQGEKITLLCNACNKEIAKKVNIFDEVLSINIDKFLIYISYRRECAVWLSKRQFKRLIQTVYSRTIEMDTIASMIPAEEKIAMEADITGNNISRFIASYKTKKLADSVYTQLLTSDPTWKMEISRNADFVRHLGLSGFKGNVTKLPYMNVTINLPEKRYYIVIPGASSRKRQWNTENFAKMIDYIANNFELQCMMCGAPQEKVIAEEIQQMVNTKNVVDMVGQTSLLQLIEYIRKAEFVLTNDTSGVHFAVATQTPSICIAGEHNIGRFLPYKSEIETEEWILPHVCTANMPCAGCTRHKRTFKCIWNIMIEKHFLCIKNVSYKSVEKEVDYILSNVGEPK